MKYSKQDQESKLTFGQIYQIINTKMTSKTHKSKKKYTRKEKHKHVTVF
jgi:hypothetical protein